MKKIAIGGDHAGFELKTALLPFLAEHNYATCVDFGPNSSESVDYPDYAHQVADFVSQNEDALGILICGSGNGVCMTANKYTKIRAALCWNEEIVALARAHNNANILCIPARFVSQQQAENMVKAFLNTAFEGGRHQNRINKIPTC